MKKKTKMNDVLRGNCRNIPPKRSKKEEFFNKTDAFLERLQECLINKRDI